MHHQKVTYFIKCTLPYHVGWRSKFSTSLLTFWDAIGREKQARHDKRKPIKRKLFPFGSFLPELTKTVTKRKQQWSQNFFEISFDHKFVNLQYNTLVHWADGINDSSTKRLTFSVFVFIISYRLRALKTIYFHFCNFIEIN